MCEFVIMKCVKIIIYNIRISESFLMKLNVKIRKYFGKLKNIYKLSKK